MEHLMESRSGEQTARDTASQAEQILSLLERRGLVEDPSIINPKARETEQELRRNMYHNSETGQHYRSAPPWRSVPPDHGGRLRGGSGRRDRQQHSHTERAVHHRLEW